MKHQKKLLIFISIIVLIVGLWLYKDRSPVIKNDKKVLAAETIKQGFFPFGIYKDASSLKQSDLKELVGMRDFYNFNTILFTNTKVTKDIILNTAKELNTPLILEKPEQNSSIVMSLMKPNLNGSDEYAKTTSDVVVADNFYISTRAPACSLQGSDNKDYTDFLKNISENKKANSIMWNTITVPGEYGPKQLSIEDIRLLNWLAIAEGSKGIFWQISNISPEVANELNSLGFRVKRLAYILSSMKKTQDKFILQAEKNAYISTHIDAAGIYYAVIINHDCSEQNMIVRSNYFSGELQDLETNETFKFGDVLPFQAGDARIVKLVNAKPLILKNQDQIINNESFKITGVPTPTAYIKSTSLKRDSKRFEHPQKGF